MHWNLKAHFTWFYMIHETSFKCHVEFYLHFSACFGFRNVWLSGETNYTCWLACYEIHHCWANGRIECIEISKNLLMWFYMIHETSISILEIKFTLVWLICNRIQRDTIHSEVEMYSNSKHLFTDFNWLTQCLFQFLKSKSIWRN